jgi:hypothetical protein
MHLTLINISATRGGGATLLIRFVLSLSTKQLNITWLAKVPQLVRQNAAVLPDLDEIFTPENDLEWGSSGT